MLRKMYVWVFFNIVKAPRPGVLKSFIAQQVKYVNRNALSMFKALNKGFK